MSVSITINVTPEGRAADVSMTTAGVGEAPPPVDVGSSQAAAGAAADAATAGPPPLDPAELGMASESETGAAAAGPPPTDLEGVGLQTDAPSDGPPPPEDVGEP